MSDTKRKIERLTSITKEDNWFAAIIVISLSYVLIVIAAANWGIL